MRLSVLKPQAYTCPDPGLIDVSHGFIYTKVTPLTQPAIAMILE